MTSFSVNNTLVKSSLENLVDPGRKNTAILNPNYTVTVPTVLPVSLFRSAEQININLSTASALLSPTATEFLTLFNNPEVGSTLVYLLRVAGGDLTVNPNTNVQGGALLLNNTQQYLFSVRLTSATTVVLNTALLGSGSITIPNTVQEAPGILLPGRIRPYSASGYPLTQAIVAGTAPANITLDTAENYLQAGFVSAPSVGEVYECLLSYPLNLGGNVTLVTGAGITLTGTTALTPGTAWKLSFMYTNVTDRKGVV